MNIKITYNWLLEYLETDVDPYDLAKYLSLSGPSFESVDKIRDDYVFDIEVTSNRVDMASVFGIAQEAQAILPQFNIKAKLKINPFEKYTFNSIKTASDEKKLDINIEDKSLCQRFTALVMTDVNIKQSPDVIRERLRMIDIKSINNVIDISNYLMVSLGQPTHMFDYDMIKNGKMTMRESKKGEKLTTLDGVEVTLPGGDIVIEDGSGKLIDLCGIMGGKNSSITENTKNIVFFVQTYDKKRIRKTSMTTGQRTVAATYFEKGLDPKRVENTISYGVELLEKLTDGKMSSTIYDIYPDKDTSKDIRIYLKDIYKVMGISISEDEIKEILNNLGFKIERHEDEELAYPDGVSFQVKVPSYRFDDVEIKEDIIEEVARVYGYHNLPSNISPMVYIKQPQDIELLFKIQNRVKSLLKYIGLNEVLNYSMISQQLIDNLDLDKKSFLKLENSNSTEIEYMRTSLMPSLINNIKMNQGRRSVQKFFEIAKTYHKVEGKLPDEKYSLAIAVTSGFHDLKGIIETVLNDLNISNFSFKKTNLSLFSKFQSAEIISKKNKIGEIGKLDDKYKEKIGLSDNLFLAEIEFDFITSNYRLVKPFVPPTQYSVIKLDATIKSSGKNYAEITAILETDSVLLKQIEYVGSFKDNITLRFYFSSLNKNLTEVEAKDELNKLLKRLK